MCCLHRFLLSNLFFKACFVLTLKIKLHGLEISKDLVHIYTGNRKIKKANGKRYQNIEQVDRVHKNMKT